MKLWVDDVREMPKEYDTWAKTYDEAMREIRTKSVTKISLDHDLGEERTGYDIARYIEKEAFFDRMPKMRWAVHSANPVGREKIAIAMSNAERYWVQRKNDE